MLKRIFFLLILLLPFASMAQPLDTFAIDRISNSIKIDGIIDEEAWENIVPLPLVTYSPNFGEEGTERTEIRVGYDDRYIYFSARMYVSDPKDIQGNSLIRDLDLEGDFFNILLDSYNDNENMLGFFTTPTGQRLDAEVTNDAEGPNFWNQSWNSFWDNAVTRTQDGWFAEVRVPFSSLRFEDNNGEVIMGLIVQRRLGRKNERLIFPAIPPKWNFARNKPSKAQKIILRGVYSKKTMYLSPFLVASRKQSDPKSYNNDTDSFELQTGIDAKFGLSSNMTLDLTFNTDFAQVEADLTQVNLTQFSLFFPEKRQFFQERSGIFAFNTGDETRLFHSRRIGLTATGEPIKMIGGARLNGRLNNLDLGVLTVQTAQQGNFPSENFGVIRIRNRVINKYSFIGAMLTSRLNYDGQKNINYGLDGIIRVYRSDYLSIKWAHTVSDSFNSPTKRSFIDEGLISIDWENRSLDGFAYKTTFTRIGENYDPAAGFIFRNNITSLNQTLRFGKILDKHSSIFRMTPYASGRLLFANDTGQVWEHVTQVGWRADFLSRATLSMEFSHLYNRLFSDFNFLEQVIVPIGEYNYDRGTLSFSTSAGQRFRASFALEAGSFFTGTRRSARINPSWNLNKHISLGLRIELNRIEIQDEMIEADVTSINLTTALDTHFSIASFLQYNKLEDQLGSNVRLRYNFREGHDLFLVYNNKTIYSQPIEDIGNLTQTSSMLTLKYLYTLVR